MKTTDLLGPSLLAFAAIVAPAHALAQSATGTLIPGRSPAAPVGTMGSVRRNAGFLEAQPTDVALKAARAMAACIVSKRPEDVKSLLAANDTMEFARVQKRLNLSMERCAGRTASEDASEVQLGLSRASFLGLLAEAWMLKAGAPNLTAATYVHVPASMEWISDATGQQVIMRLAECLATTKPQEVRAFVSSSPGSPNELSAFRSVTTGVSSCLERDVTLKTNKTGLRLAVAPALYRRAALRVDVRPIESAVK